jgi:MoxR-like ATPase
MLLPPRTSALIEGNHGLGKSNVVAQTAARMSKILKKPFGFIDFRLSQKEVGDLIGMPRGMDRFNVTRTVYEDGKISKITTLAEHVTIYDAPSWFPTDQDSYGFLFLDEINRATRECQQAAFELVLDYRLNFMTVPMGWRVIAAINDNMDVYSVLGMEPALYSRFLKIKFRPTTGEWLDWGRGEEKEETLDFLKAYTATPIEIVPLHDAVLQYIGKFTKDLELEKYETGVVAPDRRAWVMVSTFMKNCASVGYDITETTRLDYLTQVVGGYVGTAIASNFVEYVRKEYRVWSPREILDKLTKEMETELKAAKVTEIAFYNDELVRFLKTEGKKAPKETKVKRWKNLFRYYQVIPHEASAGFLKEFSKQVPDLFNEWYASDPDIGKYSVKFLGRESTMKA